MICTCATSWIACSRSITSKSPPSLRESHTGKRSPQKLKVIIGTRSKRGAQVSSARSICASSLLDAAPALSSWMQLKEVSFRRNSYLPLKKACARVLDAGPIAGYPVQDVRVVVYDGKHHPVDSKEVAFISAGKRAFMDAISKAHPIVLEPIVKLEITAPEPNMGDIAGDISAKRGQISGTDAVAPGTVAIKAQVPLSELNNYQARLKSVTAGQGSYSIELSHYEAVPPNIQKDLAVLHSKTAVVEEQ